MQVFIERNKENMDLDFEGKAEILLDKLKINKEEVLVVCNAELITLDKTLKNTDKIRILSVISGG